MQIFLKLIAGIIFTWVLIHACTDKAQVSFDIVDSPN